MPAVRRRTGGTQVSTDERPTDRPRPITKSDSVDFEFVTRGIYVGTGGVVMTVGEDGFVCPWVAHAGVTLVVECVRVNATGTTATDLVALF